MGRLKQKKIFKKLSFKKSIRFFLGIFVLTTISLLFYYITPILFAWSGPSDLPPGGNIDLVGIVRNRFSMVEESVSGNVEIDLSEGSVFKHTLTGNVTYTGIMGFSLGKLNSFKLVVEQGDENVYEITWPGNITWKNYEHPLDLELSSGGIYDFVTSDDGTTWYGSVYYDSREKVFVDGGLQLRPLENIKPMCSESTRGMMWVEQGNAGEQDIMVFCGKHSDGTLEWQTYASMWKGITATGGNNVYTFVADGSNGIAGVTYRVHMFTSVGTSSFNVTDVGSDGKVEYLIVAGGGGGASDKDVGGGGGAGGYRSSVQGELSGGGLPAEQPLSVIVQPYAVTVGNGGVEGGGPDSSGLGTGFNGTNGGNSSVSSLIAIGGGGGGTRSNDGLSGGSGGGGGDAARPGGAGVTGQGNAGGTGPGMNTQGGNDSGGGGGAGSPASFNIPGNGRVSSITGNSVTYAAGGRGSQLFTPFNAVANTGNGGDGKRAGGSGIVIIRYPISNPH